MCAEDKRIELPAVCEVCGNAIAIDVKICSFCGAKRQAGIVQQHPAYVYRTVNLEKNMPSVDQALRLLQQELFTAPSLGFKVLVLIHGYGSSGKGGAIKKEVHRQLGHLLGNGRINDFLPGEQCTKRSGHGRHVLGRFPSLSSYFKRPNPGITLVVI